MNESRRPLKTRGNILFQSLAVKLSEMGVSPNQISVWSIVFSVFAVFCFFMLVMFNQSAFAIGAAIFIQLRLLCNLLDGLVAIEGKKATPTGVLYNEIPDRIADSLIIVATGYAINSISLGSFLGWYCALMAIFTAYVRVLATSVGAPTKFTGPMAKPHRMALLTGACLLTPFESYFWGSMENVFLLALVVMSVGVTVTVIRRSLDAAKFLKGSAND